MATYETPRALAGAALLQPPPAPVPQRVAHPLPGISIVLPCFDEAANVAASVHAATHAAERVAVAHEVLVVDDGSSDATAAIAAELAARDPRVRLLRHDGNRGYGQAVRTGIGAARMPWVFLTDADLQFDLGELTAFVEPAAGADLVIGWRIQRCDPLMRRVDAAAWNWLVRRAFGLHVRDVDCAFKLMRRDVVANVELTTGGAMISTELLAKAIAGGARVRQLGVHHRPRVAGEQSGAKPRVVLRAFRELAVLHHRSRHVLAGR
jgi:glycosyltransferase involved in cell wall biosynthesis